jgi:hypothetical protein
MLRARRARNIELVGELCVAQLSYKPAHRIHVLKCCLLSFGGKQLGRYTSRKALICAFKWGVTVRLESSTHRRGSCSRRMKDK